MMSLAALVKKLTHPGVLAGHWLPGVRVGNLDEQLHDADMSGAQRIDIPLDPSERVAFVRRWVQKNQRIIKQGGIGSTLVIPLLAQMASANETKVPVEDVLGVEQVIRQPNGSITLLMQNGAEIDIAAAYIALENGEVVADLQALLESLGSESGAHVPLNFLPQVETWQALPDGNIEIVQPDGQRRTLNGDDVLQQGDSAHISPSQALQYGIASPEDFSDLLIDKTESFDFNTTSSAIEGTETATSASSGWGVSPWVYVGGGALALGAAAGGGGGGGGGGDSGPSTISGFVLDGPISGATVTRENNGNEVVTNGDGFFSGLQGSGGLIATGGVDIATGLAFTGTLRAPEGSTVITPLTTLMVASGEEDPGTAEAVILSALGLEESINLRTTNPLNTDAPNEALVVAGVKVASLLSMAQAAGIQADSVLADLYAKMSDAYGDSSRVDNADMAALLNNPSITKQVKEALDAIDAAGESFNVSAYRQGPNNPLSEAQINAQDPNEPELKEINERADIPYYTLNEALGLAESDNLPAQYLIDPDETLDGGTLGLTAASEQLSLVERILEGDYDAEEAPIALADIYTWSIQAKAEDVLVSGGLRTPEVEGAERVTLTNATIRPDQFSDLKTLDNFELGDTVVPYTLEEALETAEMPSNFTLDVNTPYSAGELTVQNAAELINETRRLLDLAQNTGSDGLTRDQLLDWQIVDSVGNVLATPSARPQIDEAESIRVTEAIITPAEFVQLNAINDFVLEPTEVDYTLAEALTAEPLASNYIIDLDAIYNPGAVTVAKAAADYTDVTNILDGANNQPPLTLFEWQINDNADAIIPDIDQLHVTEANQVSVKDRVIDSNEFDQLNNLERFDLGTTNVLYTLENAVNADTLAENYEIDTDVPFEAGDVSVEVARTTLADVESILDDALNPQTPNANELFNWTVVDTAETILEALEDGNVPHLTGAEAVNVDNDIITIEQFEALSNAAFNYVRIDEQVEYTLDNAISIIDDGDGPLVDNYVIDLDTSFDRVWSVNEGESYFAIIDGAENKNDLLASELVVWQIEDSIDNLLAGISNVDLGDSEYDDDAILNAETVRATSEDISQTEYETLLAEVSDTLRLDASATVSKTTVNYANLEAAVEAQAGDRLAPADFYTITTNATYENPNGPLSVANARTEIETVKSILNGSTNREPADFEELYDWGLTDSAGNILDAINSQTDLPEVLQGAGTIFAANGGDEGDILAEEYDDLVVELGKEGFDYNEVEYTLAYVFDSDSQPPAFATPGDLAERYFFSEDVFNINEALGETETISVAESEEYYNAVAKLVDENTDTTLAVTDIYEWNIVDSAEEFVTAYNDNNSQHPAHISDASLVEINDTATITFDQYEVLEKIPGFQIQEYTLEEAVNISLEANRGLATNFIIDTQSNYQAQDLSVTDAETYRNTVNLLTGDTDEAARNSQLDSAGLETLYSWTIEDSAEAILNSRDSDGNYLEYITGAEAVSANDDALSLSDFLNLDALEKFALDETPVNLTFTENRTLDSINDLGLLGNYNIMPNDPLTNFSLPSLTEAQVRYEDTLEIVNGAQNSNDTSVEALQEWQITNAQPEALYAARNEAWVTGAKSITLALNEGETLTPEWYEAFVTLDNVTLDGTVVSYTLEDAYGVVEAGTTLPDGSEARPGSYQIDAASDYNAGLFSSVLAAQELLEDIEDILKNADNSEGLTLNEVLAWEVEDTPEELKSKLDAPAVRDADSVRVNTDTIDYQDFETLSELDNFDSTGATVSYPLDELVQRFLSGEQIPQTYALNEDEAMFFNAGSLSAQAAKKLHDTATTLIEDEGLQNNDITLSELASWTVQDSYENIYRFVIDSQPEDFLIDDAASVVVTDDPLGGGEEDDLIFAFGVDGYTHDPTAEPADSIPELSSVVLDGDPAEGSSAEDIANFQTGAFSQGGDQLFIDLTTAELDTLRGDGTGFVIEADSVTALGANEAFAVFTTAEFTGAETTWLSDLGLEDGEVAYLLAGNGETTNIDDDAQVYRVEGTAAEAAPDAQLLANIESIALNDFTQENWLTSYDNQSGS